MRRTAVMQNAMVESYPQAAINAVLTGKLDNAWRYAIADYLFKQWLENSFKITALMIEFNISPTKEGFTNLAQIILDSEAADEAKVDGGILVNEIEQPASIAHL